MFNTEIQKTFYGYLGLLSCHFAEMEENLSTILRLLIDEDDEVITVTLISNNNLDKNLKLLKEINNVREFEPKTIDEIIKSIDKTRIERNLFIHGIWHLPKELNDKSKFTCESKKLKMSNEKSPAGFIIGRKWVFNNFHHFTLTHFENRIIQVRLIIHVQEQLIQHLRKHGREKPFRS